MPISSAPSTSKRLLALLSLLQSGRDWPAHALAQRLAVSERTVRRDIDRLRELDYVIDATRGPDGGYRLAAGTQLPPLLFDDGQAVAIALALGTAGSLGAGIADDAERALATLRRLLPSRLAHRIENVAVADLRALSPEGSEADPAVLLRIGEAIRAHRELRFDYAAPHRTAQAENELARRAQPHSLVMHRGRWYLLAYSTDHDDWRTYRVDRITPRSHDGRVFSPRTVPGGDPARFVSARFKGAADGDDRWPCRGSAELHAPISTIAPYLEGGTAEPLGDDRCRVVLGSWSWHGLAAAFLRFDVDLTDVEPAELRTAFAALHERLSHL